MPTKRGQNGRRTHVKCHKNKPRRISKTFEEQPNFVRSHFGIEICNRNRQFIFEFKTIVTPHTMSGRKRVTLPFSLVPISKQYELERRKDEPPQAIRFTIRQVKLLVSAPLNTGDRPFSTRFCIRFSKTQNFNQLNLVLMDFAVELISIEFCLLSPLLHTPSIEFLSKKTKEKNSLTHIHTLDTFPQCCLN